MSGEIRIKYEITNKLYSTQMCLALVACCMLTDARWRIHEWELDCPPTAKELRDTVAVFLRGVQYVNHYQPYASQSSYTIEDADNPKTVEIDFV